jgi:hypothetical protein
MYVSVHIYNVDVGVPVLCFSTHAMAVYGIYSLDNATHTINDIQCARGDANINKCTLQFGPCTGSYAIGVKCFPGIHVQSKSRNLCDLSFSVNHQTYLI